MKHLDLSLPEVLKWWSSIDTVNGNLDLAGVRALCKLDRYYLLVRVCNRVDMLHPWIYARCREVEKAPDNFLDLWAREHFKSSIITFGGTIQKILNDPEITIGIFSHVNTIATDFLRQIKLELENNQLLKAAFPDILYDNPPKQSPRWSVEGGIIVKRTSNPKEATVEASGLVDGQPIGKHFQLRIYDDIVTDKSVATPDQVSKTTDAFSLSQSLGVVGGKQWIIGTRYNFADTYEWLLERGAVKPRIYPATHNGLKDGIPVYFPQEEWEKRLRNNTDNDIACQYMQNPLSGKQHMFDITQLQIFEVRPETLAVYITVDPARSKKKGSANTAMLVIGVDYALNKYLLDGYDHKMDLKERWESLAMLYMKWAQAPGVQSVRVGYESFGAQADMDYFQEQMRLPGRPSFDITELQWPRDGEGSKTDRVQRLVPDMKTGKIFVPYPTNVNKLTANQIRMMESGYDFRVAKQIKRTDENGVPYDLVEHLRMQLHFFPYGGLKDVVDALSRIYDMEPRSPLLSGLRYAEPAIC